MSKDRSVWLVGLFLLLVEATLLFFFFIEYFFRILAFLVAWMIVYAAIASGSGSRGLAAIPVPLVWLFTSLYPSFVSPLSGLLIYAVAGLAVFGSIDFSKGNMSVWISGGHRYLRSSLRPFVLAQKYAMRVSKTGERIVSAILILLISLLLGLMIPLVAALLFSSQLTLGISLIVGFAYLLLVREEATVGAHRYKAGSPSLGSPEK